MREVILKLRDQGARWTGGGPAVVGLGECSLDLIYALPGPLSEHVGGKLTATAYEALGGGQVATAMCAAARLGCATAFVGAVGDDSAGRSVLAGLAADGVATSEVVVMAGVSTRSALLLVDPSGERTVIERRDPGLVLPGDYLPAELLRSAQVLHVDATYPEAALCAAELAAAHGLLVSIDVDVPTPAAIELVGLADLCVVPLSFAQLLTGEAEPAQAARQMSEHTPGLVVLTLGAAGSLAVLGEALHSQPALVPPGGVVDTTACGDTFRAALIAYLLQLLKDDCAERAPEHELLAAALRFASAAAALKCQKRGRAGCPTWDAVTTFLAGTEPAAEGALP